METNEIKTYSLAELKDKYIGNVGTAERDTYEKEVRVEVLRNRIKTNQL